MDIWGLLGIEPTTDIERIKSAYASQAPASVQSIASRD